jgi:hypothetical protein
MRNEAGRTFILSLSYLKCINELKPPGNEKGGVTDLAQILYWVRYSDINSLTASQKAHKERINADESSKIHSTFIMIGSCC